MTETETNTLILVTNDKMGHGDDELGSKLMVNFLKNLNEMGTDLWRLIFLNNGVKLATDEADALSVLQRLEADGLHILVCTTCLQHFNLEDKKRVGSATNMPDIVNAMQFADKVITI